MDANHDNHPKKKLVNWFERKEKVHQVAFTCQCR